MTVSRAVLVVATGLGGIACILASVPALRRTTLAGRLDPYLGRGLRVEGSRPASAAPGPARRGGLDAALRELGGALQARVGDRGGDLASRLAASGSPLDASGFRAEQVLWALAGCSTGLVLDVLAALAGRRLSAAPVMVGALTLGAVGAIARDRALTRAGERRRRAVDAELATFVDLVCIAVTAGESLRGALELVARSLRGPLGVEVHRALRDARAGRMIADVLAERATVLGVAAFDRFVGVVTAAQERGLPLVDALRALAGDVREESKRSVLEAGGRKQVSMLVPVVGLVLPVAIVFAFYPGVIAMRTLVE